MARDLDHIALANKNHDALMYLINKPDQFSEWIVTIAFYKAVQVIEAACIHTRGRECAGHERRHQILELPPFNSTKIFHHHRVLWNESSVARYLHDRESHKDFHNYSDRIKPNKIVQDIIRDRLVPLEQIAIRFMSDQAAHELKKIHVPDLPK